MHVLVILSLWMTASIASPPPLQPAVLEVGSPVDSLIASGESEMFAIRLDAGQTALIELEGQRDWREREGDRTERRHHCRVEQSVRGAGPRRKSRWRPRRPAARG